MKPCCHACGRALPKPKIAAVPSIDVDTSTLTDAELFSYYKRTSLAEDLRFILRRQLSTELRARLETIATPTARDLSAIRGAWRTERLETERAQGDPAIGSPAWAEQFKIAEDLESVAAS